MAAVVSTSNHSSPVPGPDSCPACRSTDITTRSNTQDGAAYWRCLACGEVWNQGRRQLSRPQPWSWR